MMSQNTVLGKRKIVTWKDEVEEEAEKVEAVQGIMKGWDENWMKEGRLILGLEVAEKATMVAISAATDEDNFLTTEAYDYTVGCATLRYQTWDCMDHVSSMQEFTTFVYDMDYYPKTLDDTPFHYNEFIQRQLTARNLPEDQYKEELKKKLKSYWETHPDQFGGETDDIYTDLLSKNELRLYWKRKDKITGDLKADYLERFTLVPDTPSLRALTEDDLLPDHLALEPPALDLGTRACISSRKKSRTLSDFADPKNYLLKQKEFLDRRLTSEEGIPLTMEDIESSDHKTMNWCDVVDREDVFQKHGKFLNTKALEVLVSDEETGSLSIYCDETMDSDESTLLSPQPKPKTRFRPRLKKRRYGEHGGVKKQKESWSDSDEYELDQKPRKWFPGYDIEQPFPWFPYLGVGSKEGGSKEGA